jgi:hypothetical protein
MKGSSKRGANWTPIKGQNTTPVKKTIVYKIPLFTFIAPKTFFLAALRCFTAVKALLIPLGLLNCPHQIGLFCLSRLDVMFLGDSLDLFEFHYAVSPLFCFSQLCVF